VRQEDWDGYPSRVERNTRKLLELFASYQIRATFFTLGWVAERFPRLVQDIAGAGHEIGCHSYAHSAIWKLSPSQFREDTRRALDTLQNASGQRVAGYRAPTFSVVKRTFWAVEILAELGFRYDSSIFPISHDTYGVPDAPRSTFLWKLSTGGSIFEIPMSTACRWGRNFPAAGGGYLRLLPEWYTRWAMRCLEREDRPAIIYLHPWEMDPEQPRIRGPWKSRLRHYTRLDAMQRRLESLLQRMQFTTMSEVLDAQVRRGALLEVPLQTPTIVMREVVSA
jgi:polysaccharide deacetylase family protein (PEP-CTERM system associated)